MSRRDLLSKIREASSGYGGVQKLHKALCYSRQGIYNKLAREDGFTDDELLQAAEVLGIDEADQILARPETDNCPPPDRSLLVNCIIAVEELVEEMGSRPTHEAKANVIAEIYALECERRRAGQSAVSGAEIIRILRSA